MQWREHSRLDVDNSAGHTDVEMHAVHVVPGKMRFEGCSIMLSWRCLEHGEGWSDGRIIEALDTSASMIYRVRRQLVEEGIAAVLSRKQRATPAATPDF